MVSLVSKEYATFTPAVFDRYDCVNVSKGIYLITLFVLRAYIIWLISVTNFKDTVVIIQWLYPDPNLFYLNLFSGLIGVFVVFVWSLRRPAANSWIKTCWCNLRAILVAALLFDIAINTIAFYFLDWQSIQWLVINSAVVFISITFLFTSKKVTINVNEFPELVPKK